MFLNYAAYLNRKIKKIYDQSEILYEKLGLIYKKGPQYRYLKTFNLGFQNGTHKNHIINIFQSVLISNNFNLYHYNLYTLS